MQQDKIPPYPAFVTSWSLGFDNYLALRWLWGFKKKMYRQRLDHRNTHVLTALGVIIIVIIMKKMDGKQQNSRTCVLNHTCPHSLCVYADVT